MKVNLLFLLRLFIDLSNLDGYDEKLKSNLTNQIYFLKAPHLFIPKVDRTVNSSWRVHSSIGHRRVMFILVI